MREINYRYGDEIAATFLGGTKEAKKREATIQKARAGEIRCIVGIRMLIQTGINIAQWNVLYNIQPMNNAPNWEQESNRICTPLAGKKTPIIRFFIDTNLTTAFSCVRSTIGQNLTLGHTITDHSRNKAESLGIDLKSVKDSSTRKFESGLGRNL